MAGGGKHEAYERLVLRLIDAGSTAGLERTGLVAESVDAAQIARGLAPLWNSIARLVTEIRVNGVRVDARLQSDDGRAWLAVLWLTDTSPSRVVGVTTFERPPVFAGRPPGLVVVLNGPSSVGKSSLMAAFADAEPTPWSFFDEPMLGRLATKFQAWPASAGPVVDGFLVALAAAARVGNQLIVSSAGIAQHRFRDALTGVSVVYVGLDAPLVVLLARQLQQGDKLGGLAEESVGIHAGWTYDLQIDTSLMSPDDAARLLSEHLASVTL
jgi:chloramphenicol 3-O phosphotransferase